MINLTSVYEVSEAVDILFDLLLEREPHQSISHKEMPTFEAHRRYVGSVPYLAWYLIQAEGQYVGSIYLSKQREIGVSIYKEHRGNGYGQAAVKQLMEDWPGKCLANINPENSESILFFKGLGAKHIQNTYEL